MKCATIALTLFALLMTGVAYAEDLPSVHKEFLDANRHLQPGFETFVGTAPRAMRSGKATRDNLGFYPYWVTLPVANIPYGLIDTVAFFSLELNQYGNLTSLHGWPHGALVNAAHAAGSNVVVTITNFTGSQLSTLLASSSYRATAVANIVAQVVAGNADGVNIDFENLPASAKSNLVTFMTQLRVALEAELGDPHISVCTPAIDWAYAYDFDKLAEQADYLFIMAYNYHYSSGDPGPVAPLHAGGDWPSWAGIDYTLDDYETYISPYTLRKVILGLPLYGYEWPTTSDAVPGTATGSGSAVLTSTALSMVQSGQYGSRKFDAATKSPYLAYNDGSWHQLWYTDWRMLVNRWIYGLNRNVGGVGIWALGYSGDKKMLGAMEKAMR
jgi:spore germination protein YaaH